MVEFLVLFQLEEYAWLDDLVEELRQLGFKADWVFCSDGLPLLEVKKNG